jgi:hypothetical protein
LVHVILDSYRHDVVGNFTTKSRVSESSHGVIEIYVILLLFVIVVDTCPHVLHDVPQDLALCERSGVVGRRDCGEPPQ